eukprot:scaffold7963_cov116-Isochrysis_galbana.AAC.5
MDELGRLARRSKGPGAVDHTRYGLHRSCPQCFVVHHMQRLSKALLLCLMPRLSRKGPSLSSSRHATSGQLLCWERWLPRMRYAGEGALKAPFLGFSPLAGASSWGVLCRSCCLL